MKYLSILALMLVPFLLQGQIITTIAGTGTNADSGDGGPATAANITVVSAGVCDNVGNYYFSETYNNKIRMISASGIITTIAGTGAMGDTGDGGPATAAELYEPRQVAYYNGILYVADVGNIKVRAINLSTGIITTFAGTGSSAYGGDGGPATAASLAGLVGITADPGGNIYFTSGCAIREVNTANVISTYAGWPFACGANGGDGGPATAARIDPINLCSDSYGNIYIATATEIRKITAATGIINSAAGVPNTIYSGFSGDGGPATAAKLYANDVAVDKWGNIFIADDGNNRIRYVDTAGIITTIAGDSVGGYNGDSIAATAAELHSPQSVALDTCGNLYINDVRNYRIRKITFNDCFPASVAQQPLQPALTIYPNPAQDKLTIISPAIVKNIIITNMLGQQVLNGLYDAAKAEVDVSRLRQGIYFITVNGIEVRKFVKQ